MNGSSPVGGDRLPVPADEDLTDAQRRARDAVTGGPRGGLFGPFIPLLRAPELMDRLQAVGAHLRYEGTLPRDVFELAVLVVARRWDQPFEWAHHQPLAVREGVAADTLDALAAGRVPQDMTTDQAAAHRLVSSLLDTGGVPDEEWDSAVRAFGEAGVVELAVTAGYYTTLALVMNAARTPVPEGTGPLLPPRTTG